MRRKSKIQRIHDPERFKEWFEKIYEEYYERLYRYAFSITKSKDLAEDVAEEVFMNIWTRQDRHLEIRELASYLYVSVKHLSIRALSNDPSKFLYSNYENSLHVADAVDPESLLLGDELEKIVSGAIRDLPPYCAVVYDMLKNKGMSYDEVSQELGISKKTVENHICKALAKIRNRLLQYYEHTDIPTRYISGIGVILILLTLLLY